MAIEDLELPIPNRRELVEQHLRYRDAWNPGIDRSEGGEPYIDAVVAADTQVPLAAHARRIGKAAFPTTALAEDVPFWGDIEGVEEQGATGSVGLVRITASVGGGEIPKGSALTIKGRTNGPRFECLITGRYFDSGAVPIGSLDLGPETNLEPGTVLEWFQPPSGIGPTATVIDQDGEGLTGGRAAANAEEHREAILDKRRDPPGGGNDAEYRYQARKAGVPVRQAFSYPAIMGPGTTSLALVLYPPRPGGTRAPTSQQLTRVGEFLDTRFGADDSLLMALTLEQDTTVAFRIDWAGINGWVNSAPWPSYGAAGDTAIVVSSVTSATAFSVGTDGGGYSGVTAPTVGKSIGLYDASRVRFVEKRIATVTGSGPWALTIETANNASDQDYTPVVGQRVSPWSKSLDLIAESTVSAFDQLGPGEMVQTPQPDGRRRYRQPAAPARWPYRLTQDLLEGSVSPARIGVVADRELVEGDGESAPVGLAGQYVYLLRLGDLAVFPKG